ncbi:hypothetical protein ACFPM3_16820 [Streptomyces coeruleoprunus]|uniref:Uncharacterized protein n=1 Tax=Streptomyces coeruleoprunus TaxID=285563 RepID=A0ABV9XH55_9ACTN
MTRTRFAALHRPRLVGVVALAALLGGPAPAAHAEVRSAADSFGTTAPADLRSTVHTTEGVCLPTYAV